MKKVFMTALMGIVALTAGAQSNLQFHWDLGKHIFPNEEHNRQDVTITYEGFHADKLGSWYYFIDADFGKNGMTGAYTEISREFTFKRLASSSFDAHVEIDAGLSKIASQFQPAFLIGPAWNWHNANFSKTFSLQVMYKQFTGQNWNISGDDNTPSTKRPYSSFQVTGVWGINFCNDKLRFAGFIDFWRGVNEADQHGNLIILTEPQLWYNISKNCAIGTEWEISNNFIYRSNGYFDSDFGYWVAPNDSFYFNPTLAFKYQF